MPNEMAWPLLKWGAELGKASFFEVERAAAQTNTKPSPDQIAAGNYKKGSIRLHGMTIKIENPAGSIRRGTDRNGKEWAVTMPAHYGYFSRTKGFDGDQVDVWIGPVPDLAHAYVINQLRHGTDKFDEHKVGIGFHHESDFVSTYRNAYPNLDADQMIHSVVRMPIWRLRRWLMSGRPAKQMAKLAKAEERLTAEKIATMSEGRVARMIERTMSWVRGDVIDDIIAGLRAGADPAEVAREVAQGEGLSEKLGDAADTLEDIYVRAGQEAAGQASRRKDVSFQFDARNPKSATYFDAYRLWLVREMSAEQEQTIQTIAREGILSGKSLDAVARDLRVTVGLTAYQARNVMNYRRELEQLDAAAMLRALRDRRYDSALRRAIENNEPLAAEQITKMVEAYHRRYVAYRSITIARTEGLRAANMGVMASAYQAIDDGVVQPQNVVKRWIAKLDQKTRDTHAELNGQEVRGIESPFQSSSGALLAFPGDPSAPPRETINCRCSLAFTMLPSNS